MLPLSPRRRTYPNNIAQFERLASQKSLDLPKGVESSTLIGDVSRQYQGDGMHQFHTYSLPMNSTPRPET
ncbi:hypothetical protein ONS95_014620 [Cadophora gregata]|uniref:uncharacterized protein n=1 Tax=Cadophora gregata TaxID=51156 RepID=UPI0026DCAC0E|nr:uncharacterized protein ONS95_014620 [Cadophora gregata]KAK0112901.1 hypothetical protein ONS95_014620 [Cadophora gregata]